MGTVTGMVRRGLQGRFDYTRDFRNVFEIMSDLFMIVIVDEVLTSRFAGTRVLSFGKLIFSGNCIRRYWSAVG